MQPGAGSPDAGSEEQVAVRHVLGTNGTYDPNAGGWQTPGNPQVSVSGSNPLIGVANGGPGGTGFTSATRISKADLPEV